MTEQQAEKLVADQIAGMRDDLAVLAGTTDADKLIPLVFEKTQRVVVGSRQLRPLVWRFTRTIVVAEYYPNMETVKNGLAVMEALADVAQRRPDLKAKLVDTVAKKVPLMDANLDKIAQALREKATKTE